MKLNLREYLAENKKIINAKLGEYLEIRFPEIIWEAMRYSVLADGKRIRPILLLEAARVCGADAEVALPTACALEMVHCYSLIHDDLPCMDNDDFRRGNPTNHKVFGEGMAVLAGDALLSFAPQIIIKKTPDCVDKAVLLRVLNEFYTSIGPVGMVGGQVADIQSENKEIDISTFTYIHTHKTGELFKFALMAGGLLGGADEKTLNALVDYGKFLGYAFQIADDILDIEGDLKTLGKTPHKDLDSNKNTHPKLFGLDNSKIELNALCEKAKNVLKLNNILSEAFDAIADSIVNSIRNKE
ncbi:MAG: polyprenyl synthetase family protein [Candidatus Gastranaerophilales bacterium]|nr:polyprenyl synthetase family protein [Candidatus Gastranaerophilales bacterium]